MARYIDADILLKNLPDDLPYKASVKRVLMQAPTADVVPKTEWISCKERMPDDMKTVLVWFEYFRYGNHNRPYRTYGLSYAFRGNWSGFINGSSGYRGLKIFAWQPLPNKPIID